MRSNAPALRNNSKLVIVTVGSHACQIERCLSAFFHLRRTRRSHDVIDVALPQQVLLDVIAALQI